MNTHYDCLHDLPFLIIAKDTQSRYLSLSNVFSKLVGWKTFEEAIGKTDYDIPCQASEFAEYFIETDKKIFSTEKKLVTLDIMPYSTGLMLVLGERNILKNEKNETIGLISHGIDVSNIRAYRPYLSMHKIDNNLSRKNISTASYILSGEHCPLLLSNRQQECLFLLVRGKTIKEIGRILKISPRTVEDHMNAIKSKMDCYTKSQLIEKAIDSGFLYYVPRKIQENEFDEIKK